MLFGRKKPDIGKLRTQAAAPVPYGFDPEMTPDYSDKPAMQAKPSIGKRLIGSALDGLGAAFGLEPTYLNGIQAQRQSQLEAQNAAEKFKRERDAKAADAEAESYRPQQVGRTIVARTADGYKELYREPEQATQFQRDLGALGIPLDSPQARQIFQSRYDPFKTATIPDGNGGTVTVQTGGLNTDYSGQQNTQPEPAEIERFVASFPREAQPAIRAKIAEGGLGGVPSGSPVDLPMAGKAANSPRFGGRPVLGRKAPEVKKPDIATMSTAQKLQRLRELRGGR